MTINEAKFKTALTTAANATTLDGVRAALRLAASAVILPVTPVPPAPATGVNLTVTALGTPQNMKAGDRIRFAPMVKNIGGTSTPAETIVDVLCSVDGVDVSWSDNMKGALPPAGSRIQPCNGGPNGADGTWLATPGEHTISATVNTGGTNRAPITETDRTNNTFTRVITVAPGTVVTPPVVIPPPQPNTARKTMMAWIGWVDTNDLGAAGMQALNGAKLGALLSLQDSAEVIPDWIAGLMRTNTVKRGISMYGAKLMLDPALARRSAEALVASCAKIDATVTGLDLEPYVGSGEGVTHTMWSDGTISRQQAQDMGMLIGSIYAPVGECVVYTSSDANYPGGYQDKIQLAAGNAPPPSAYTDNVCFDFMKGLTRSGLRWTYNEAAFHWGVQTRESWEDGFKRLLSMHEAVFPGGHASPMTWPDNDEGHGEFGADDMRGAWEAATRISNGTPTMYQHTLGPAWNSSKWQAWLSAARAAADTAM